jgi:AcrR family transcriptional regulator
MTIDTTPPSERPLRADARRNRERIVAAARAVFTRQGGDAQIDDIARAAGVGVGTVYRHFPHKEALLGELLVERFRLMADNAERALEIEDPWEAFAWMLRTNATFCAGEVGVQQALVRGPDAWEYAAAEIDRLRETATQLIVRAQRAGVMRPDFSVDDIPMLMAGLTTTMTVPGYDWHRHLEIILAGIRATA